jgi:hypothetical protein
MEMGLQSKSIKMIILVLEEVGRIMLRCKDNVLAFQTWEQFVGAVDLSKCSYKADSQKGNKAIGICIVYGDGILQEFKRAYYRQG